MREHLALAEAAHNEPRRVEALSHLAWLDVERGDLGASWRWLDAGLPAARALPHPRAVYVFLGAAGRVQQMRGEYALAEAMNLEAWR